MKKKVNEGSNGSILDIFFLKKKKGNRGPEGKNCEKWGGGEGRLLLFQGWGNDIGQEQQKTTNSKKQGKPTHTLSRVLSARDRTFP